MMKRNYKQLYYHFETDVRVVLITMQLILYNIVWLRRIAEQLLKKNPAKKLSGMYIVLLKIKLITF